MRPDELIKNIAKLDSKTSGIYLIYCAGDNKGYVGQSKNIYRRWTSHKELLRKNLHENIYLQNVWNKYGKSLFSFLVLEHCLQEQLNVKEAEWASKIDSNYLINIGPIGNGHERTENSRLIYSKARKKWWGTPGVREKMSKALTGRKMPEGYSERQSIRKKGKNLDKLKEMSNKALEVTRGKPISLQNKLNLLPSRRRKFTNEQANKIRQEFCAGKTLTEISKELNTTIHVIFNIIRGRSYLLDCDQELIRKAKEF